MRIALAKLLLREPSPLLLDEPTNHLDLDSQRWLENYLKNYDGALMIISHDRTFLDILCNRTFELSLGNLNVYEGNYSYFEKESVQRKQLLQLAYKNQQKKIEQQERFIERFRAKATKARQVQSRIKALDKMEKIELEAEESRVHFSFPPAPQSGHIVLELKNAAKSYDSLNVFQNLDFKLERGDRFAVVGVNGAGKSTLAKVLAGIEPLSAGQRDVGLKVRLSYFAQNHAEALDPTKTVLETIEGASNVGERINLRTILGAFLFRGDDVFKSVSVLSGGEKCRLALACMVVQKANCLILDEPTNHLDMRSQEMLQHALSEYQGTLLIVSHNRGFLDPLVNKVLAVSKNGVEVFLGNVSEYLEHIEQTTLDQPTPKAQTAPKTENKLSQKERRKQRALEVEAQAKAKKRIDQLEKEIESLESIKKEMEEAMMDPQFFKQGDKTKEGLENYESLKRNLDRYLEEWSNLN